MQNIFTSSGAQTTIDRINHLTPQTQAQWGKMNVAQMLAHCNAIYDMAMTNQYTQPGSFKKFLLKIFVKNGVVGSKPYPKNSRTAPDFIIADERNFAAEKKKLVDYINQVQKLGGTHFNEKESHSFGSLTENEWNALFSKHLDHHLTQFAV